MAPTELAPYKAAFLSSAIAGGALKFGTFELKSKRISPYFFNSGEFNRADLLDAIGEAYARAVISEGDNISFDVVFGPAYKGIPLAAATALHLGRLAPEKFAGVGFSFDRKEAKDHGEGGSIVGAALKGKRVLVVDDVVTEGAAKRDAVAKIRREGGEVVGIVVAVDRMEKLRSPDGDDDKPMPSAIGQLRKELGVPILAILTLDDIIEGMKDFATADDIRRTEEYRAKFKPSD